MMINKTRLSWQEPGNDFAIDCELDIAIHPSNSNTILLIVPGVDGDIDGYKNKYLTIANNIVINHKVAVVRMANPFIGSQYWQSNVRMVLQYIEDNAKAICGNPSFILKIVGHSIGAYVVCQIAWEYPFIDSILLINPATGIDLQPMAKGLLNYTGTTHIVIGSDDPAIKHIDLFKDMELSSNIELTVVDGADHHFSGEHLATFISLPSTVFFK